MPRSTRSSRRRARSPSTPPSKVSPAAKRQRKVDREDDNTSSVTKATDTVEVMQEVPAALKLVRAMKEVTALPKIGYCPSKIEQMASHMMSSGPDDLSEEDIDRCDNADMSEEVLARESWNRPTIAKLSQIAVKHAHNAASGYLDSPFRLRITRSGCKFDEKVTPAPAPKYQYQRPYLFPGNKTALENRLKQWHLNADASGYGDVREQVTKVDHTVRRAREIPASDFEVEPALLERIAALWDEHFFPNSGVRVEPYKIHLYGPGDHFSVHRDTPQKDLVGTFLMGLGDTSYDGGLNVDGTRYGADEGHWCAFYPDVPHSVKDVHGYRATLAFKLFRASDTDEDTSTSSQVRQQVSQLVEALEAPFGILLQRKYCLGTTSFSGFDALLLSSLRALANVDVRHLPVVLGSYFEWGSHDKNDRDNDWEMSCTTAVYPFTKGHVDALLDYVETGHRPNNQAECGAPWLDGVKHVPFFSLDLKQSLYTYKEEEEETCNYTGNEAQAWREDSVYLSYALLVLPRTPGTSDTGADIAR
ncbi:hypothetical protein BD309DRAFT_991719 [Dichomitus squalens]|nr:hypothetical protein BD309DRAFT_991719 [Dichomitus squalens]